MWGGGGGGELQLICSAVLPCVYILDRLKSVCFKLGSSCRFCVCVCFFFVCVCFSPLCVVCVCVCVGGGGGQSSACAIPSTNNLAQPMPCGSQMMLWGGGGGEQRTHFTL